MFVLFVYTFVYTFIIGFVVLRGGSWQKCISLWQIEEKYRCIWYCFVLNAVFLPLFSFLFSLFSPVSSQMVGGDGGATWRQRRCTQRQIVWWYRINGLNHPTTYCTFYFFYVVILFDMIFSWFTLMSVLVKIALSDLGPIEVKLQLECPSGPWSENGRM